MRYVRRCAHGFTGVRGSTGGARTAPGVAAGPPWAPSRARAPRQVRGVLDATTCFCDTASSSAALLAMAFTRAETVPLVAWCSVVPHLLLLGAISALLLRAARASIYAQRIGSLSYCPHFAWKSPRAETW